MSFIPHFVKRSEVPVVLKVLRMSNPTLEDIALIYNEFEVSKDLVLSNIIKTYGLSRRARMLCSSPRKYSGNLSLANYLNQ